MASGEARGDKSGPPPSSASRPYGAGGSKDEVDPELLGLPDPPRGAQRATLALLAVTALAALAMVVTLRGDAAYALQSLAEGTSGTLRGPGSGGADPATGTDLGRAATEGSLRENHFVCAHGLLGAAGALRFERPFDRDSFRLSPLAGRDDVWVEVRVPAGEESGRYVPPSSFCGRLLRFEDGGLRHRGLARAIQDATGHAVPKGAWLLVDGEDPAAARWALVLVVLFALFAGWNGAMLLRMVRPLREGLR